MIIIGKSRYSAGGVLRFGYYEPSPGDTALRLAMWVIDAKSGEREYVASYNIPERLPASGFIHIWGWESNEGVPEALVAAGIIRLNGRYILNSAAAIDVAELTDLAMAELTEQAPDCPPLPSITN